MNLLENLKKAGVAGDKFDLTLESSLQDLPLDSIDVSPQVRTYFDPDSLRELADTMKENGLAQPIIVQKKGNRFVLFIGERRYRAAKLLGWQTILCNVTQYKSEKKPFLQLIENLKRDDLCPIEIARSIHFLYKDKSLNLTLKKIGQKIGLTEPEVSKYNSISKLLKFTDISELYGLSFVVLYNLAREADNKERFDQLFAAAKDGASVREIEQLRVDDELLPQSPSPTPSPGHNSPAQVIRIPKPIPVKKSEIFGDNKVDLKLSFGRSLSSKLPETTKHDIESHIDTVIKDFSGQFGYPVKIKFTVFVEDIPSKDKKK